MTIRFGDFLLDPRTRRVLRGSEEMHLSPKAFDLLTVLIENRAQAMSKAELQQRLWPATYVLETNLAGLVAEIRRALDDPAGEPVFIRTMHRFGYWFIAAVSEGSGASDVAAVPAKYWLIWETRQVALGHGDNIIGRGPDADIWIDAPGVSRHHARIRVDNVAATIEDLDSKNGTYVRGERVVAPLALEDGDQVRLGSVVITFRIPPPAGSTETAHR